VKIYQTLFLALALNVVSVGLASSPIWADQLPPEKSPQSTPDQPDSGDVTWLEFKYSPESISGGNFTSNSLGVAKLRAETGMFDDRIRVGTYFQFSGNNGSATVGNVAVNNLNYSDLELYVKIPFSIVDARDQENPGHNPYGFNVTLGWKDTQLTGNANANVNGFIIPNSTFTFISGNGFGGGIGYDGRFSRVSINGLIAYYPSQNQSGVVVPAGFSSTYRDWVYRIYARTTLGPAQSGFGIGLGFDGESQQFSNATVTITGVTGGLDYHF